MQGIILKHIKYFQRVLFFSVHNPFRKCLVNIDNCRRFVFCYILKAQRIINLTEHLFLIVANVGQLKWTIVPNFL